MIPEGCLLVCSQCRQDVFRSDKGTLRCGRCDRDFGTEVRGPLVELREVVAEMRSEISHTGLATSDQLADWADRIEAALSAELEQRSSRREEPVAYSEADVLSLLAWLTARVPYIKSGDKVFRAEELPSVSGFSSVVWGAAEELERAYQEDSK